MNPAKIKTNSLYLNAIFLFFIFFSLFNYNYLFEDAYIYFRIVENFVAGHGYVFNPGDPHIECGSSLTWFFLLTTIRVLGLPLLTGAKIAGIIFGALSIVITYHIARIFITDSTWRYAPCLLCVLSIPFLLGCQTGLETPVYVFSFLLMVLVCVNRDYFKYWPFAYFLLILTRPEGMVIGMALLPVFYFYRHRFKSIGYGILLLGVLIGLLFALRLFYFHDLLPSAFYHKMHSGKFAYGFRYLYRFCLYHFIYLWTIPLLYVLAKRSNWTPQRCILFGFICVQSLWVIVGTADGTPFFRHIVPLIPLFFIYSISGIINTFSTFGQRQKLLLASFCGLFGCTMLLFPPVVRWAPYSHPKLSQNIIFRNLCYAGHSPRAFLSDLRQRLKNPCFDPLHQQDRMVLTGEFIRRNYPPGTVLLYDQMGRIPYQAGTEYCFIDSYGLTDRVIGRTLFYWQNSHDRLYGRYDRLSRRMVKKLFPDSVFCFSRQQILDYIFQKKPDVMVCFLLVRNPIVQLLAQDQRFKEQYRLACIVNANIFFERKQLPRKTFDIPSELTFFSQRMVADPSFAHHPHVKSCKKHPWFCACQLAPGS